MNADIKGALAQINKSYSVFEHKGESMTKSQVIAVLNYGLEQGYETTDQLTDEEVDNVLERLKADNKEVSEHKQLRI